MIAPSAAAHHEQRWRVGYFAFGALVRGGVALRDSHTAAAAKATPRTNPCQHPCMPVAKCRSTSRDLVLRSGFALGKRRALHARGS